MIRSSADVNASQTLDDVTKKLKVHQFNQSARLEFSKKSHENHRQSIHLFLFLRVTYSNYYLIHSFYRMASLGYRPPITLLCLAKIPVGAKKDPYLPDCSLLLIKL